MSYNQRGTKRAADSTASGPKSKTFKSDKPFNKGGKDFRNKPAGKFGGKPNDKFGGKPGNKFGGKPGGKPAWKKEEKKEEPAARRKRPVTQGGGDEDVDMSGDEEGDEFDVEMGEAPAEGDAPEEKRSKMSKAERAALHAQQPHRKTLLPSHALLTETLLPLWETARRLEMPKDERTAAITELWAAAQSHVLEISRGHKGGRILQTVRPSPGYT
jgi:pumilio family protein 6